MNTYIINIYDYIPIQYTYQHFFLSPNYKIINEKYSIFLECKKVNKLIL